MKFYAIMLESEIVASPHTHPVAEKADSSSTLAEIESLNQRVKERLNKDEFNATLVGRHKMYRLVSEGNIKKKGAIYEISE